MRQVLPFRSTPSWGERLLCLLAYLFFGWILASNSLVAERGITVFFFLGVLIWAFILRKRRETSYFLRYHLLEALLLNGLLLLAFWLFTAVLMLLQVIPVVDTAIQWILLLLFSPVIPTIPFSVATLFVGICNLYAMVMMLQDKPTHFPVVTENARQWS